uniref:Aminotransferase-like plant mobile domain-containing protein n=2 Tax=Oryza sativa subsp. japonica TaxID=39947 RepID=Q8S5F6_ORYSJ|nr:Hypothetical protein [Oryza sativa Japonica Group]ABB47075.1 hypothetical protein LOC_Os10g15220 [Oryza sativa Japonica Group]
MSTPASPSAAPSAEYTEHLSNLVAIPSLSHEHLYFLGPIGNPDSTEFIIAETNRIPFRLANPNLGHWKNIFKSWPSLEKTTPEKSCCGPTTNWQFLAKALETKKQIPLGKILLDYLYQMLSNASAKIATGSVKDAQVWFPYEDSVNFDLQSDFRLEDINSENFDKSREVFLAAISPCILPVGIHQGRNIQVSYEFYHPMSSARQFGMGQLLIGLYFADKIQCRGEISPTLMMDRLLNLPRPSLGSIDNIELERFSSRNFDRWWGEWKQHIFHQSASMYMIDLFPDVVPQTTESSPPRKSNSGRDIEYVSRPEIH